VALKWTVALVLLGLGQDPAGGAETAIRNLSSEDPAVRETATRQIKAMGMSALPALERASQSPDTESAARSRHLIAAIKVANRLSPNLLNTIPGVEDKLVAGGPQAWTEYFLRAAEDCRKPPAVSRSRPEDLRSLLPEALQAARDIRGIQEVCNIIVEWDLAVAIPELVRMFRDSEDPASHFATKALRNLGATALIAECRIEIKGKDARRRALAAELLGDSGAKEAIPDLIGASRDPDPNVAVQATLALGALGSRDAVDGLQKLLSSPDELISSKAVDLLVSLGAQEATPKLLGLLDHPAGKLCVPAIDGLAELGAKSAVPRLLELLEDVENESVAAHAAGALGKLRATQAVPQLLKSLKRTDTSLVQQYAISALKDLNARDQGAELARLLKDEHPRVRLFGLMALGTLGVSDRVAEIAPLLKDPNSSVRGTAARALAVLKHSSEAKGIAALLNDVDKGVRLEAISSLAELGAPDCLPDLLKFLEDPDRIIRRMTVRAVGKLGNDGLCLTLRQRASDREPEIRIEAGLALCNLGCQEGADILLKEASGFSGLNAIRSPKLWGTLRGIQVDAEMSGTREQVLGKIAAAYGAQLHWIQPPSSKDLRWMQARVIAPPVNHNSALDRLEIIFSGQPYGYVIEAERLVILQREQERKFWTTWRSMSNKK
jgi:HEAT repeat protein